MERIDVVVKTVVAFVSSFISYMVGGLGLAFTVLIGLQVLDYMTGILVGYVNKNLKSAVGFKGLTKKLYVIILISALYLIEHIGGINLAGYGGDGLAILYALNEFLSILENGGKLGVPIPRKLRDAIVVLKGDRSG
jgi:toxin secretion/phage lysis holin